MVSVLLFAQARAAAGVSKADVEADTVAEAIETLIAQHGGEPLAAVVAGSRIWCNGQPTRPEDSVSASDELAVIPPVSGGMR